MRLTGTIKQIEVRNLNAEQRAEHLQNVHKKLQTINGPGIFHTVTNPSNGDIDWTYDYAEEGVPGRPAFLEPLKPEEVEAIYHARILMCNLGNVKLEGDHYVATISAEDDPAIIDRVNNINVLEKLLSKHGRPTIRG